jgi:hypothetical protein
MTKDKAMVAAMLNPPFSVRAEKAGLKDMGTAAAALGAYQGTSAFVLREWGKANTDTVVKYVKLTLREGAGVSIRRTRMKPSRCWRRG